MGKDYGANSSAAKKLDQLDICCVLVSTGEGGE